MPSSAEPSRNTSDDQVSGNGSAGNSSAGNGSTDNSSADNSVSQSRHASIWPDVSLVGVALIWGINIPVMKNGLDQADVYVFNAIRLMVSVLVLAVFAVREYRGGLVPVSYTHLTLPTIYSV